jgi:hypothetical protein
MSNFKILGLAVFRAHEYGVWQAALGLLIIFFFFWTIYRRYHRMLQRDRASKSLYRTNVFVVVDDSVGGNSNNNNNATRDAKTIMKRLEEESDDDDDDLDYSKLLRELDTPQNINKRNDDKNNNDDDENEVNSNRRILPPPSTTRAHPFALRLMDAIEHTAVTQLAELIRLQSSLHRQENRNAKVFMDQTAVFDIPENIARSRAVSLLEGALRQRRQEVAMMTSTAANASASTSSLNKKSERDADDQILDIVLSGHCTSAVPSPASILNSNRLANLTGTRKSDAPFMRHKEAYYCTCIDSTLASEDSVINFAAHFAYGLDVGKKLSSSRLFANMFLGEDRFAKSNLRGGHVITAGGTLATMPDPIICRAVDSHLGDATLNSTYKELADDWAKGASWSQAQDDTMGVLLRRYDELVVLCLKSPPQSQKSKRTGNSVASSSSGTASNWNLPSCIPMFATANQTRGTQPRVIALTTPHSLKYILPEYSSPRDSTVSSQRRYRYHLENVAAIRKALEQHAEDIAIEGFRVGERVLFKRSPVNKMKEALADAFFGFGKFFNFFGFGGGGGETRSNNTDSLFGGITETKKKSYRKNDHDNNDEEEEEEEMSKLVDSKKSA